MGEEQKRLERVVKRVLSLSYCGGVRVQAKIDTLGKDMTEHCFHQALTRIQGGIQFCVQSVEVEDVVMRYRERTGRRARPEVTDLSNGQTRHALNILELDASVLQHDVVRHPFGQSARRCRNVENCPVQSIIRT